MVTKLPLSEETVRGYSSSDCYSHDALGNPIDYGDVELWWEDGRRLSSILIDNEGLNVYYTYDSDGLRTSKTVNGVKHEYLYDGDKVVYEKRGEDQFFYYYDSYGHFSAIRHIRASDKTDYIYYANTNSRGDVVGLYTGPGVQIVSYEYDAWGNVISMVDLTNFGLGTLNPIRYRGYYYDEETNWYYLQSRYYDPEIGRFINVDGFVSTGQGILGYNMYAYCQNNPIIYGDPTGCIIEFLILGGLCLLTAATAIFVHQAATPSSPVPSDSSSSNLPQNIPSKPTTTTTTSPTQNYTPPNFDSPAYTTANDFYNSDKEKLVGQCTWYAYGRALELTGAVMPTDDAKDWFYDTTLKTGTTIRANSVACFVGKEHGHVVYIEAWDPATQTVYYSEGNTKDSITGKMYSSSLDYLLNRWSSYQLIGYIYTD